MDINESQDVIVAGGGAAADVMTAGTTLVNHGLVIDETAAAVAEHRKEVA